MFTKMFGDKLMFSGGHEFICKSTNGKPQNPCNGFASVIQIDSQNLALLISSTSNQKSQTIIPTMALFN
jgi:hypothetical protein